MTLQEAIEIMEIYAYDYGIGDTPSMRLVLAAARAFACETCGGTGEVDDGSHFGDSWIECSACREDRKLARGE